MRVAQVLHDIDIAREVGGAHSTAHEIEDVDTAAHQYCGLQTQLETRYIPNGTNECLVHEDTTRHQRLRRAIDLVKNE